MDVTETKESESVAKYKTKGNMREGGLLKSKHVTPVAVLLLKNNIQLRREIKYVLLDLV